MIYSFIGESLIDHSTLTLAISLRAFGNFSRKSIISKLQVLKICVDPQELERAMRLAYLLHDIGKAMSWYQRKPCKFPYHEVLSSKIVTDLIRLLGINLPRCILNLISASVLFHHQAMRDIWTYLDKELMIRKVINKILSHEPRIRDEDIKDINILSLRISQIIPGKSEKVISYLIRDIVNNLSVERILGLVRKLAKEQQKEYFFLIPLFLVPLQMADNTAASILRPCQSFSRLAKETLRLIENRCELVKSFTSYRKST